MSNQISSTFNAYSTPSKNDPNPPSSQSVATDQTVNGANSNGRKTVEYCVKAEFVSDGKNNVVPITKYHRILLEALSNTHTHSLIIYDKLDRIITKHTISTLQSNADHQNLFDVFSKNGNDDNRKYVVMKFKSSLSLNEIKSHLKISEIIHRHKIYLRIHNFSRSVIDTTSIGWLYGKHPSQHDHATIKSKITNAILALDPDADVPQFHLQYCTPSRIKNDNTRVTTKALEIVVDRRHAHGLDKMLKEAFKGKTIYVKWKLRHSTPETYADAMIAQSNYLADVYTVPIFGITEEQMKYLLPRLIDSPFCTSVEKTRKTESEGRWNLLTKKKTFTHAKHHVRQTLSEFEQLVPEDISHTPPTWKKSTADMNTTDVSSEGDDSYMTTSARSFASIVTAVDRANERSTPIMIVDMSKVKQDEAATNESMTASEVQIQILTDQNQKLMEQIATLSAQVASLLTQDKHNTLTNSTEPEDYDTSHSTTNIDRTNKSHIDRITALENTFNQAQQESKTQLEELKNMLRQSLAINKRTETEAPDANSPGPANKRADTKTTPKKSPSLAKADIRQNP